MNKRRAAVAGEGAVAAATATGAAKPEEGVAGGATAGGAETKKRGRHRKKPPDTPHQTALPLVDLFPEFSAKAVSQRRAEVQRKRRQRGAVKKGKKNRVGGGTVPKNAHPHSASTDGVSLAIHYHHEEAPALLSRDELEQEWLKKVKEVKAEKWLVEGEGQGGKMSSSFEGEGQGGDISSSQRKKKGVSRSSSSSSSSSRPAPKRQKQVQGGDKSSSSKRKRRGESSSSCGNSGSDSNSNSDSDSDSNSDSGSICVQRRGGVRGGFVEGPNGTLLKNWPTGDEQLLPPVLAAADPGKANLVYFACRTAQVLI